MSSTSRLTEDQKDYLYYSRRLSRCATGEESYYETMIARILLSDDERRQVQDILERG